MRRISRHALRSHDNSKRIKIRRIAQTTSWSRATRIDSANTPPRTTRSHDVFKVDYLKATQLVHLTMLVRTQLLMVCVVCNQAQLLHAKCLCDMENYRNFFLQICLKIKPHNYTGHSRKSAGLEEGKIQDFPHGSLHLCNKINTTST